VGRGEGGVSPRRVATVATVAAVGFIASYTGQRLLSAWAGEPDPRMVLASAHVAYFGRLQIAALHAVAVAALVGFGLREAEIERAAGWLPWLVGLVAAACFVAMVGVP
jgi:hypothetical protein